MKRNCNGCKALDNSFYPCRCKLGIPIETLKEVGQIIILYKPLKECNKPKTFSEYYKCLEDFRIRR